MPYASLHDYLPKVAERETRSITILPESDLGLPPGNYGFLEMFCDETGCDCRRVFFYVVCSFRKEVQAVVAWGWEEPEFYAKWMRSGDAEDVAPLKGPILNLGSPETELAPAILALVENVLLKDAAYVDRVKRHYSMFRREIDAGRPHGPAIGVSPQGASRQRRSQATGVGRNDPCPCGSGKKFKKCCLGRTGVGEGSGASAAGIGVKPRQTEEKTLPDSGRGPSRSRERRPGGFTWQREKLIAQVHS